MKNKIKNNLNNIILFLIMCIAFSIPFGYIYARKIIVVVFVLWLFTINKESIIRLFKTKVFIMLTLFVFIHILSLLWSEDIEKGREYINDMLIFLYFPILIFSTTIKQDNIKYILNAFIAGMFINEIISYLIYFDLYQTTYSVKHHYPVGFINHIMYSVLVSFSAILILFQAKNSKNKYLKFVYVLFFITMTTNLVISSGRTGYIVYFASLVILLFTYYKVTMKNFIQILLFPSLVFIIGYKLDAGVQARVNASISSVNKIKEENYNSSFGARVAVYPMAYDILSQPENSFIWGMGTGNIRHEISKCTDRTHLLNVKLYHLHNSYLEAYVFTGILGLVFLILIFYYILKLDIKNKEIKFIQQLIIINISIAILSDVILSINEGMLFFSIFTSLSMIQSFEEDINT